MKDVAREADAALGTVSKVINGVPVDESYCSRVEDAIKKLDYHVNFQYIQSLFAKLVHQINTSLLKRQYWSCYVPQIMIQK